jgi:hypothetical protein
MSRKLKEIIFLDITNKMSGKFINTKFNNIFNELSEKEQNQYYKYSKEIHQIWGFINSINIPNIDNTNVNSVFDYNDLVTPVSNIIIELCDDFDLTLRDEINPKLKELIINIFGIDYYNEHFLK